MESSVSSENVFFKLKKLRHLFYRTHLSNIFLFQMYVLFSLMKMFRLQFYKIKRLRKTKSRFWTLGSNVTIQFLCIKTNQLSRKLRKKKVFNFKTFTSDIAQQSEKFTESSWINTLNSTVENQLQNVVGYNLWLVDQLSRSITSALKCHGPDKRVLEFNIAK